MTATRQPADVLCVVCGRPLAECTVPGLHGAMRDRAAVAAREIRERPSSEWVRRAREAALPTKDMTRGAA